MKAQLLATIDGELEKVAASVESDAIVLVDMHQNTLAAAGPHGRALAARPAGGAVDQQGPARFDGIARMGGAAFRVVAVPLQFGDGTTIGTLYLATSLDAAYAEELARLAGTRTAIVSDGLLVASTLPPGAAREFEAAVAATPAATPAPSRSTASRTRSGGWSRSATRSFYALGSIDESSRGAMRQAMRNLAFIAVGAIALALVGSLTLARLLSEPIGRLSTSLAAMAASHDVTIAAAAHRIEPRARRAHRDVQRR